MAFPQFDKRNGGSGCANNTAMNPFCGGGKQSPAKKRPEGLLCCGSEKAQSRGLRFFCAFRNAPPCFPLLFQEGGFFNALFDSEFEFYL